MNTKRVIEYCEFTGSALAIIYTLLIASNTNNEMLAFLVLLIGSIPFSIWAIIDKKWAFLLLQVVYAVSAVIGLVRWGG